MRMCHWRWEETDRRAPRVFDLVRRKLDVWRASLGSEEENSRCLPLFWTINGGGWKVEVEAVAGTEDRSKYESSKDVGW